MAALPLPDYEAGLRALDAACESTSSAASTRSVVQLGKLPLAVRKGYLLNAIIWDLGNLVRCCLQELSPDVRFPEHNNSPAVCAAASVGSVCAMKALLKAGANLALAESNGMTALGCAARCDNVACVRLLLEAGADARSATLHLGNTPLMLAVARRSVECARALIPASDLLQPSGTGLYALHTAIYVASEECFELLLPLMEDVDVRTVRGAPLGDASPDFHHQTSLHIACMKGLMAIARTLLKRGADRMARDSEQRTPLLVAAWSASMSCIILLVGRPEKPLLSPEQVDAFDRHGMTAMHCAAHGGYEKVCGVLIAMGASLDSLDSQGNTPLAFALERHPDKTSLLELLSGLRPANLPGTVCDHCGKPAGKRMVVCSACEIVRYCDAACQLAGWEGHEAECNAERKERELWTTPLAFDRSGEASDA